MNLNVPVSPGIIAGVVTMATATITDTSSKLHNKNGWVVIHFTQTFDKPILLNFIALPKILSLSYSHCKIGTYL